MGVKSTLKDLTGKKIGRLTVVRRVKRRLPKYKKYTWWLCKCECGKEKIILASNLNKPNGTKSCGCITRKHGLYGHPIHNSWECMKARCLNPKNQRYHRYGGRGIKICQRWLDFKNFYDDMLPTYKKGLTIDRIDNDGNYCPENCRWATLMQQSQNISTARPVENSLGQRFSSIGEAIRKTKFTAIPSALKGRIKTAGKDKNGKRIYWRYCK